MIYRNLTKILAAAFFAAWASVGSGESIASAQQYVPSGTTVCAGCSQTINFQSTNVSSTPMVTSDSTFPDVGQVVYSSPATLPTATYATWPAGNVVSGTITEPVGTVTSMPATIVSAPVVQPRYYAAPTATPVRTTLSAGYRTVSNGLAQMKAQQAASGRIRGHIGGGLGGARYEGVGWSSQSAQAAIQQCCYWGTRPTAQIGVSRGSDGLWYACVLYN